jgi:hypothetical protein
MFGWQHIHDFMLIHLIQSKVKINQIVIIYF